MDISVMNFWGQTKFWWLLMILGVLMIPLGLWIVFSPVIGYETVSMLFGWSLILFGVVQLLVSSDKKNHPHNWGWWLAGGIFDIFIGFVLVGNLVLSELILPFFFAFIFLYKGISNIVSSITMRKINRYWWLYMFNGILMIIISFMFFYAPYMSTYAILFLCAFTFIYWGMSVIAFSFDLKPNKIKD